jgi:hypothetical protein
MSMVMLMLMLIAEGLTRHCQLDQNPTDRKIASDVRTVEQFRTDELTSGAQYFSDEGE